MEKIAASTYKNGYFGLGLADNGVLFGVPEFVKASEKIKKPYIVGLEIRVNDDFICLYAINEEGYHHLIELSTAIQKEEFSFDLLKEKVDGITAIIVTYQGKFKELFTNDDSSFNKYLFEYSELFKDGFYLGIEVTSKADVSYANKIRKFAHEHTYNCVAFPRILYQKKEDAIVLKIVEAIEKDEKLNEKELDGQSYFMTIENYQKIYTANEINNSRKILESSSFNFHQKRGEMLHYQVNDSA